MKIQNRAIQPNTHTLLLMKCFHVFVALLFLKYEINRLWNHQSPGSHLPLIEK